MNAGQHLGNTKRILENLNWEEFSFDQSSINYFQVLNWLPDYVSLIDIIGNLVVVGIIDYIPMFLPFLGRPSFNFFSMKKKLMNFSENTIITSEDKIFHDFHFDSLTSFKDIVDHWSWLEEKVKLWMVKIEDENDEKVKQHMLFSVLAQTLHAVQDFYSHSNWIEYFHHKFQLSKKEEFPTWFDIFVQTEKEKTVEKYNGSIFEDENSLFTGYFPIGRDKKIFPVYHNDKKNMPGLNKDRAERPYFDVVYYLAYKNGIQWLNYIKNKYLLPHHIELLNKSLTENTIESVNMIKPYIKLISFKLREWNGLDPFGNISLEITNLFRKNNTINFTIRLATSERLIKYDRDFRKSFFDIVIISNGKIIKKYLKFGKKSGISKVKLDLDGFLTNNSKQNLLIKVEYGLLHSEQMIINEY